VKRRLKIFKEGYLVLEHLRKERFPRGTYTKLKMRNFGPCRILKKFFDNAYVLEFPAELDISPIFDVSDLYEYHEGIANETYDCTIDWKDQIPERESEEVAEILY